MTKVYSSTIATAKTKFFDLETKFDNNCFYSICKPCTISEQTILLDYFDQILIFKQKRYSKLVANVLINIANEER